MSAVRDEEGTFLYVECDDCKREAPSSIEELSKKQPHGLIGLGWECLGGKHVCPECVEKREQPPSD